MAPIPQLQLPDSADETARIRRTLMRHRRNWVDSEEIEVEMTPLIDCVFLLLIFFLVTTMLKKLEKQIPVVLPDSTVSLAAVAKTELVILGVDKNGAFLREDGRDREGNVLYAVVDDFAGYLKTLAGKHGTGTPIRIDAERTTPFQKVIDALDICAIQGFENVGVRIQDTGRTYFELSPPPKREPAGTKP